MKTIVAAALMFAAVSASAEPQKCVVASEHACSALRQQVLDAKRVLVCHENKPWGEDYVSEQRHCPWPTQPNAGWVKAKDGWCLIGYHCAEPRGGA